MAWIYNSSMSSPALPWNGTLLLDAHVAVLQGHAGGSDTHAHYAHQLLLSDGALWQVEVAGVQQQGQRLWLPSFQPHAILSAPEAGCTVFLEPAHADPGQIEQHLHALPGNKPVQSATALFRQISSRVWLPATMTGPSTMPWGPNSTKPPATAMNDGTVCSMSRLPTRMG